MDKEVPNCIFSYFKSFPCYCICSNLILFLKLKMIGSKFYYINFRLFLVLLLLNYLFLFLLFSFIVFLQLIKYILNLLLKAILLCVTIFMTVKTFNVGQLFFKCLLNCNPAYLFTNLFSLTYA